MKTKSSILPAERIVQNIYVLRGQRVMLSTQLAELYGVEPKVLMQAVKRNRNRFPHDFMFQLTRQEFDNLKSQIVTSKRGGRGGLRRAMPYAFTEQGVAMLSSVLNSERAVQVNIEIMRTFVRLRHSAATYAELVQRMDEMEDKYDAQFLEVFEALEQLTQAPESASREIGFRVRERRARYAARKRRKLDAKG